jgi:hypothetical protein
MRRGWRFLDFTPGAEAFVRQPGGSKPAERFRIQRLAFGLAHDAAVPGHADCCQIAELLRLSARTGTVQVLYAHQEPPAGGPGEQPREDRRPEVSHV